MQTFDRFTDLPDSARGAVIAIGNFDGVHRGHQVLLARAKAIAGEKGKKLAVLTFEPHPHRLFHPDEPPSRITPAPLKCDRLRDCGVDLLFSLPFDWDFASQSAQTFIASILQSGLDTAHIVVGRDFRFGQLRKGSPADIEAAGIPVTVIEEIHDEGAQAFSSSRVRQALRHGEIGEANEILGWEWELRGAVVGGDRRGRDLGYPTANFALGETIHPAYGIYAARVQIEGEGQWRGAAVNIGIRPMFEIPEAQVEAYIFDFSGDLYGKILRVRPVQRLRGEARFDTVAALIAQMDADCRQVREILHARHS